MRICLFRGSAVPGVVTAVSTLCQQDEWSPKLQSASGCQETPNFFEAKMRSIQFLIRASLLAIVTCILVLPTGLVVAQVDRAGLDGTITDPSGKVIPGVHVIAEMPDTGLKRETVSSPTGTYDIPELPVGIYTITFNHPGFKTLTFVDVKQVIGRTRTLDATLQVAGGEERVEVSTSSEQMDKSSDALGGRIEKVQAEQLPINGRNWTTLSALVPAAVDTGGSNQRSIRFAGPG